MLQSGIATSSFYCRTPRNNWSLINPCLTTLEAKKFGGDEDGRKSNQTDAKGHCG